MNFTSNDDFQDEKEKRRNKHNRKIRYHDEEKDQRFYDGGKKRKLEPYKRRQKGHYDDEDEGFNE